MAISEQLGLNPGIDGILGLGPNYTDGPSYVMGLKNSSLIDEAIISFSLGYNDNKTKMQPSYMMFGGVNEDQFVGDLHSHTLQNNKWWALDLSEFLYDHESLARFSNTQKTQTMKEFKKNAFAVIDTGTSLTAVPEVYYNKLVRRWRKEINGKDPAIFYCEGLCLSIKSCEYTKQFLSNITFRIGDTWYDIMPETYLFPGEQINPKYEGICIFAIMPLPKVMLKGLNMFLLGDIFIRNFYSVFDFENHQVKLALNTHA